MPDEKISTIDAFGEDTATEADEDCWILLSDVTKAMLPRTAPPVRGKVIYAAFPGRTFPVEQRGPHAAPACSGCGVFSGRTTLSGH